MKKANEILFEENRKLILDNLPATFCDLRFKLNIHHNTIRNHLKQLKEQNEIHVCCRVRRHTTGPMVDCYNKGFEPLGITPVFVKQPDKIPKQDFLTTTFYGLKKKAKQKQASVSKRKNR
jgi:hypothetical protein